MTPDGITDRDWDNVHTLALAIIKASLSSGSSRRKALKAKLLQLLGTLQTKYGVLPSILATYADYTENDKSREALWLRAYALSKTRHDAINQTEIAHSLADFYMEKANHNKGTQWLMRLTVHARKGKNRFLQQEIRRLRTELRNLRKKQLAAKQRCD